MGLSKGGRPQGLSRVGFLPTCLGSDFVPVGAGVVGMWGGDPCGRPSSCHRQLRGRPQGSPPNPSPPPPLRGRGDFSPKNLPVRALPMWDCCSLCSLRLHKLQQSHDTKTTCLILRHVRGINIASKKVHIIAELL